MSTNCVSACLLDVRREQSSVVLKPEFSACCSDSENTERRNDRNNRDGYDHLRDREPLLLCYAAGAFHLTPLPPTRSHYAGPDKLGWPNIRNNRSVEDQAEIAGSSGGRDTGLLPLVTRVGNGFLTTN
jgi:hypothetical protein